MKKGKEMIINKIKLNYFDIETNNFVMSISLEDFILENNYEGLDADLEKMHSASIGDVVLIDHEYIIKKG